MRDWHQTDVTPEGGEGGKEGRKDTERVRLKSKKGNGMWKEKER